jgi:hypothetical protein
VVTTNGVCRSSAARAESGSGRRPIESVTSGALPTAIWKPPGQNDELAMVLAAETSRGASTDPSAAKGVTTRRYAAACRARAPSS